MILETIFPWQIAEWRMLWQSYLQKRLPHALLLSGIDGIGKKQFALALAHSLLCVSPGQEGNVCGQCRHCQMLNSKFHPDLMIVEPEESGKLIKIDQIREVVEFVTETAHQGGYRVIILNPANAMNINAANALLKSLEEPSPHCLFILTSHQSLQLLPTIRSRCQHIFFNKPSKEMALQWLHSQKDDMPDAELILNLANGAPRKALELLEGDFLKSRHDLYHGLYALYSKKEDPLLFAAQWLECDLIKLLYLMQSWVRDLLVFKLTQGKGRLFNFDFHDIFFQITQKNPIQNILRYIDYLQQLTIKSAVSINMNRQLVLEELFIQWVK